MKADEARERWAPLVVFVDKGCVVLAIWDKGAEEVVLERSLTEGTAREEEGGGRNEEEGEDSQERKQGNEKGEAGK